MTVDPDPEAAQRRGKLSPSGESLSLLRRWGVDVSSMRLWLARFHGRGGRVASAEFHFQKILLADPINLAALTGLAALLMRQKRFGDAVPLWVRAVGQRPADVNPAFQLGRAYHRSGRLDDAMDWYLQAVTLNPAHDKAIAALEEICRIRIRTSASPFDTKRARATEIAKQLSRFSGERARAAAKAVASAVAGKATGWINTQPDWARTDFDRALEIHPDLPEALRGKAVCSERAGDFQSALAALDRLADVEAPTPELSSKRERLRTLSEGRFEPAAAAKAAAEAAEVNGLLQAGGVAYSADRLDEAEACYREVLALHEGHARALMLLSRLYVRQRRFADVIGLLTPFQQLQPGVGESREILAAAFLHEGQIASAARLYADLAEGDAGNAKIFQNLGRAKTKLGEWEAAQAAWARFCELQPDRLDAHIELAFAYNSGGRAEKAATVLDQVLRREPDNRAALRLLARVRHASDPEAALGHWTRLAELEPANLEPPLQVARLHQRRNRHADAEIAFRAVLERQPDHAEALASLARIVTRRSPDEGLALLSAWQERNPQDHAPLIAIARLHAAASRTDLAEAAWLKAREMAPTNIEVLTGLGRFYSTVRRTEEATAAWSALLELAPESVEPKLQLARLLQAQRDPRSELLLQSILKQEPAHRETLRLLAQIYGRTAATVDRALDLYQRLAGLDPDAVLPYVLRGRLLESVGRLDEAEAALRDAWQRDPKHPMALADLARFYRLHRRYEEAIGIYEAHLRLDPQRMDAILGMGQCLDRLNRLEEALAFYEQALAQEPRNVTALGYRARLLRARGEVDASIADFRKICELDPGNADAWHELIFQLAGAEHEQEALDAVGQAEVALGARPRTWNILGRACAAALFHREAVGFFERAIAAEPGDADHHAQLGLYYFRQGIFDAALHHLLDSRDLDPRNVPVARTLFDVSRALREFGVDHVALRHAPRTVGSILLPERLFARVRELADAQVAPYDPVPRRIVAISATLAPGGAERQLVTMLGGLSEARFGLDLQLFCTSLTPRFRRDFFLPVLDGTGIEVIMPEPARTQDYLAAPEVAPFAELIRHFPRDMVGPIAFWLREFKVRRPEVVHAWQDLTCLMAVAAALLAGVPRIVLCCRSVRPDNPRRRLRRFMREAYRAVLAHPSVVLSNNSRAGADDYADWLGIDPARIEVVYNGIDFERLARNADPQETLQAREGLGIPADVPVLGGVFRMSEEKRPLLWLDVAAAVSKARPDAHFVVCGDGPMRDEMRSHSIALGIADRVHLAGAQSNIGSWYKLMDVVMLTSRHEGLPNVLLEAQSLGVPVVAPDVGGTSEVVEQGITGWTVKAADASSLAERVLYCLADGDWRRGAVERAPRFVRERFGVATMLRRNLDVYGIR